ncbi:MAG: hypothetical protein R3362_12815, partial [Rhodothermales bacterium]|nr:hypothetical protein [Rhodothermales bacterium]
MNLQTFTGPTIQAALAEARRRLGEDVVLLESAAEPGQPARVTVLADGAALPHSAPAPAAVPAAAPVGAPVGAPVVAPVGAEPAALGFGYGAARAPQPEGRAAYPAIGSAPAAPPARRGRLFAPPAEPAPSFSLDDVERLFERHLAAQFDAHLGPLRERLDALERLTARFVPAGLQRWASHPLCHELLEA